MDNNLPEVVKHTLRTIPLPTPDGIDLSDRVIDGAFGTCKTDVAAAWLILFAQKSARGWVSFTRDEIIRFYNDDQNTNLGYHLDNSGEFLFDLLDWGKWFIKKDERYHFTVGFILHCYELYPRPLNTRTVSVSRGTRDAWPNNDHSDEPT